MWYFYSLICLLCWSGSDLFSKLGSKPSDKNSHWTMTAAVGVVMGLHAAYSLLWGGVSITFADILHYLPASILYISSMIMGYIALRYIELSVSSPICNSSGALAALLCLIFLQQTLSPLQTAGVIIVCIGVTSLGFVQASEDEQLRQARLQSANVKYSKSFIALLLPILYCLLDACGTFADAVILQEMQEEVANVSYELTFLLMGVVSIIVLLFKREKPVCRRDAPKLCGAVFETAGQLAYVYAIASNAVAAAPVISAYCVLSVVWSRIFLKEKLSLKHYLAIAATVVGIIILAFE